MLETQTANELAALQRFRADVMSAVRRLDEDLDRIRRADDDPTGPLGCLDVDRPPEASVPDPMREDVLVRKTSGPKVTVFHSAENPCGRVDRKGGSLDAFRTMSYGRAVQNGLRPCSACAFAPVSAAIGGQP